MASGWNLWVWLVGVVRRYIDILIINITFPYSTCISSFLTAASLILCLFLNVFVQYSTRSSKNIRDCSKIEITRTWRYNYIDKNVRQLCMRASSETSTCEVPCDVMKVASDCV